MTLLTKEQAEQLTRLAQVDASEKEHTGTAWTRNESFDKNGYYPVENICDPNDLICELPEKPGVYNYVKGSKSMEYNYQEVETQVDGSVSRYWYPPYRKVHNQIRQKVEKIIGRKLYNTYYYDRFYFPGQELERHVDRPACEISVSVHVATNLEGEDADWPFWIKTPDQYKDKKKTDIVVPGKNYSISLGPGDGVIYKGCERPHWRLPMPTPKDADEKKYYYHQVFFHYVLQDGIRVEFSNDNGN